MCAGVLSYLLLGWGRGFSYVNASTPTLLQVLIPHRLSLSGDPRSRGSFSHHLWPITGSVQGVYGTDGALARFRMDAVYAIEVAFVVAITLLVLYLVLLVCRIASV